MNLGAAVAVRRTEAVRACVPAADDHDALALGGDGLGRNDVARIAFVLLREVLHREMNALQLAAENRQLAGLLSPHREAHGIILLAQCFAGDVHADVDARLELDTFRLHLLEPTVDHPFLHFEVRDAVAEEPPDAVRLLEDRHAMACACELLRGGEAGRA